MFPFVCAAGAAVDAFIEQLVPLLEKGDIIIDGGNSEYQDTQRRCVTSPVPAHAALEDLTGRLS